MDVSEEDKMQVDAPAPKAIMGPFLMPSMPHRPKKVERQPEPLPEEEKKQEPGYGLSYHAPQVEEWEERLQQAQDDEEEEERKTDPNIPHMYQPPFWSGRPSSHFTLELIRDGVSKGAIPLHKKSWYLFGRAPICDIELDHPTVSRQHAVIQYRKNGDAYLFDLGSTHGTFIGKKKLLPNTYVQIQQGNNLIRFGNSTRSYILDSGIARDVEMEEQKALEKIEKKEAEQKKKLKELQKEQKKADEKEKKKKQKEAKEKAQKQHKKSKLGGMSDDDEDMKILDQKQKDSGDSSDEDELAKPVFFRILYRIFCR